MSSRSLSVAVIIARSIIAVMKPHGGIGPALIRPSPLAHCGYRRIPFRRMRTPLRPSIFESQNFETKPIRKTCPHDNISANRG